MKRFCQTLKLKEDPALVREYVRVHQEVWPEIKAGIREVGITDMGNLYSRKYAFHDYGNN